MKTITVAIWIIALALSGCAHTGYQRGYVGYGSGYGGGYSAERYYDSPSGIYYQPGYSRSYQYYAPPRYSHDRYDHGYHGRDKHRDHDDHDRDRHRDHRDSRHDDRREIRSIVQPPSRPFGGGRGQLRPADEAGRGSRPHGHESKNREVGGFAAHEQRRPEKRHGDEGRSRHDRDRH